MLFKDSTSGYSRVLLLKNTENTPPRQCFSLQVLFNILTNKMQRGVALSEVPAPSVARYTNTGTIMSAVTFWRNQNVQIFLVAALLTRTTLASQFVSTILLWDIWSGRVLGFATQTNLAVGIG